MKNLIVIPARLESTRLPRKLLLADTGKSVIRHTYEAASRSTRADAVIVAADHPEIAQEVERFGGRVVLTDPGHPSGTDRVAEVANAFPEYDLIVNVQGDEPELPGEAIDLAISILEQNGSAQMATLATPIRSLALWNDPNCVKVVINRLGEGVYFSRAPIPMVRAGSGEAEKWLDSDSPPFFQHVGLYAYRRELLLDIPSMERPAIEELESLEQLRVIHAGIPIQVGLIDHPIVGIDTEKDYRAFVSRQMIR